MDNLNKQVRFHLNVQLWTEVEFVGFVLLLLLQMFAHKVFPSELYFLKLSDILSLSQAYFQALSPFLVFLLCSLKGPELWAS